MIKKLINALDEIVFPPLCASCERRLLPEEKAICLDCIIRLPRTHNFMRPGNRAEQLMAGRIPFHRIASFCAFSKGGILPPLIHKLKYSRATEIGLLLGKLFGADMLGSDFIRPIDFIVPVPLHPKREKKRGYNQAKIIADGISESTSIPLNSTNLVRTIYNPTQTKKSKNQRWENVKGIFEVKDTNLFREKHILLVDDVITTGSTLEACGFALQKCTSISISIATLGEVM